MPTPSDRNIIIGLVILQIAVCLPFINSFPIALDEPFSIFWAQQDLGEMMPLFESENNPPLHFILLHYWIKLFGIGSFSVRSLSLLFSFFTIPVIYAFARKFVSEYYAALVVLIFICSQFNHYHALEARVYSLFILLSVLVFYDLYRILFENKSVYFRLAICNILLLYAHYLGGFIIAIEIILVLVFFRNLTARNLLFFAISGIVTVIGYLPGIKWFFLRLGNFSEKGTWVPEAEYSELYGNVIRFYNSPFSFISIALIVLIISIIFRKHLTKERLAILVSKKYIFIYLLFVIPYFGMFIFSKLVQPIFLDRYLLFTSIPLYLILVLIINVILPKERFYLGFLILFPLAIKTVWLPENNREPDAEAQYVKDAEGKDDALKVICPPFYDLTFLYHYNQQSFSDYRSGEEILSDMGIQKVYNYSDIDFSGEQKKVIFIDGNSKFIYPDNTVKSGLDQNLVLTDFKEFKGGVAIYCYETR